MLYSIYLLWKDKNRMTYKSFNWLSSENFNMISSCPLPAAPGEILSFLIIL